MKQNEQIKKNKTGLQLKKQAIAHITLSPAQLKSLVGGNNKNKLFGTYNDSGCTSGTETHMTSFANSHVN